MSTEAKWSDFASMDSTRTLAAASRLLPPWVCLFLIVIIAWQLARILWMLMPGPAAGNATAVGDFAAPVLTADGLADVNAIAATHIFGVADAEDAAPAIAAPVENENLPDTRISSLLLRGTIASTPSEFAVAIIANNSNEEKVYGIGDPVTSGAKLHAVYADRVVLNESGALTNLKLPKDFPKTAQTVSRRNTATSERRPANTQSIQSVVANNVSKLADVIRPTPYFVNGQQQGYRVYPGRNREQFASLGLRPGDLIKDIDGQALSDPTQAMKIFQSLDSADQVSVTVERNGQPETIVLKTSQLALEDSNQK